MPAAKKIEDKAAKSGKGEIRQRRMNRGPAIKMVGERPQGIDKATKAKQRELVITQLKLMGVVGDDCELDCLAETCQLSKMNTKASREYVPGLFDIILRHWPQQSVKPILARRSFEPRNTHPKSMWSQNQDRNYFTILELALLIRGREVNVDAVLNQIDNPSVKARAKRLLDDMVFRGIIKKTVEHFKAEAVRDEESNVSLEKFVSNEESNVSLEKFMSKEDRIAVMQANSNKRATANCGPVDDDVMEEADELEETVEDGAFDLAGMSNTVPDPANAAKGPAEAGLGPFQMDLAIRLK